MELIPTLLPSLLLDLNPVLITAEVSELVISPPDQALIGSGGAFKLEKYQAAVLFGIPENRKT